MTPPAQLIIPFAVFVFAIGACIGSFLNVVIWRLPYRGREVLFNNKRGPMTLSWPPSHCPVCDAGIQWYQNIPIFSWLALKARCANCKTAIPIRYPLVELGTALLFVGFYLAYFLAHWPVQNQWFFDHRPDLAAFVLHLLFIAGLLAASAIDADLFIIPLSIPYLIMILGLIGALFIDSPAMPRIHFGDGWWLARPVAGAVIGLLLANILMHLKIIPRSFSGEIAEAEKADAEAKAAAEATGNKEEPLAPPPKLTKFGASAIATLALVALSIISWIALPIRPASLITVISGIAIFLIGVLPRDAGQLDVTDEVMEEISAPFVRREVAKELWFLIIPLACAWIAHWIPLDIPQIPWIARLLGSILGILAGGGVVWLIRIGGTFGFNKEAMGMGDAHLMAGVGTILGAPMVLIAFLLAPFVAIAWAIVLKLMGKPNVLPFGPWLSVASILCLLIGNAILGWYLHMVF